ncbi:tetratricopeptide repeat protein [Streptomyces luteolifulvus]|uniref:tetratricopeptide repeat protein n=1 Tax=Streptomyces luteolifulvus TaxID=2615112 RepID=UPI001CD9F971|nr:tetratricopeptide repeat protein [Streptomyces luteolifulvus]
MAPRTTPSAPESKPGPQRKRGPAPTSAGVGGTSTGSATRPENGLDKTPGTERTGEQSNGPTGGLESRRDEQSDASTPGNHDTTPSAGATGEHDNTPDAGPQAEHGAQSTTPIQHERGTAAATRTDSGHHNRPTAAPDRSHDRRPGAGPEDNPNNPPPAGPTGKRNNTPGSRPQAEQGGAQSATEPTGEQDETPGAVADGEHPVTSAAGGDVEIDPRVVAVRRVGAAGRRWRVAHLAGCAVLLAVALTAGSIAVGAVRDGGRTAAVAAAPNAMSPALLSSGDLDASISALQTHLRAQPKDFGSWATLGLAYVEQARTKGDPARYPQAERALKRSLALQPDNEQALAGRAALAAARHDFNNALAHAEQALEQNPYSERALCSRIDALVELGRYDEASKAAVTADSRRPGVPVFTRYAYVHELRGDVRTARSVLERALATAATPGDIAYVATALGQLAWNQGDYGTALNYYARALAADENYLPALEGRARARSASGDRAAAIKGMEDVVSRSPLPGPLVELGELYEDRGAAGDREKAEAQYALVDAWTALARANGVNADLDTALAAADHGDKRAALRAARAEWARRHTVHTADALAWALHVNGRDTEALPYARRATATGYRNASFLYHRGVIERATGHDKEARTSLRSALKLNPGFSPLGAREARKALEAAQ